MYVLIKGEYKEMKTIVMGLVSWLAVSGVVLADSHSHTIRMGTEGAYPPFNDIDDNGEVTGFERDVGDRICALAKLNCTWVTNDWDSIIPNLVSGNYDIIIAGMSITPERDAVIDFTQDYYPPAASAYVALEGSDESVMSGIVAAQAATIQATYVAQSDATLVEFQTPDETIAAVKNGEADAVLADKDFLTPYVENDAELEFIGQNISLGGGIGIGVRESDTALRVKLNAAITQMKADGSLNMMIKKWFGEDAQTY